MIVECTNVDDLIAVLHEGMKNRKKGSHDMNERSSRSHSILTVYLISEVKSIIIIRNYVNFGFFISIILEIR